MQLARPIGALALMCSLSGCADGMPFLSGKTVDATEVSRRGGNFVQPEGEAIARGVDRVDHVI